MAGGQIRHVPRWLRSYRSTRRIPRRRDYRVTGDGRPDAVLTRLPRRVIIPAIAGLDGRASGTQNPQSD